MHYITTLSRCHTYDVAHQKKYCTIGSTQSAEGLWFQASYCEQARPESVSSESAGQALGDSALLQNNADTRLVWSYCLVYKYVQ